MSDHEDAYLETYFRLPRRDVEIDYTDPECSVCHERLGVSERVEEGAVCEECAARQARPCDQCGGQRCPDLFDDGEIALCKGCATRLASAFLPEILAACGAEPRTGRWA